MLFLPTHTTANPCTGKVFSVEMHHKRVDKAGPGDNVGMNIKNLNKVRRLGCCFLSTWVFFIQLGVFHPFLVSLFAGR